MSEEKQEKWEMVWKSKDGSMKMIRFKVPGGWLYNPPGKIIYVPNPDEWESRIEG